MREIYIDPQYWEVFEGTRPALLSLREDGRRHVIVSNHVPELSELISALGLADLFDAVITSASTRFEKPHPGMYAHARQSCGTSRRSLDGGR